MNDRLTLKQAAELAGYANPAVLRVAINRGKLRGEKLGRDWFTTRAWLADYIAQRPPWFGERTIDDR